ncbi:MAG: amidohydrolase family protein [Nocardioides sp.]|uniref:amidohydrolase family protein n=1 Tax=Nocardioides sp. TaxID=35761 RepID=UPI0039E5C7EB
MTDTVLITGARVFDGTGSAPERREVLVQRNRITRVRDEISPTDRDGALVIDADGATLLPGLVDGHTHLGFGSTIEHTSSRKDPEAEKILLMAHGARVMLDFGITSAYSGGNRMPRAEVAARKAFAEGWLPGPRFRAASWEGSVSKQIPGVFKFPGIENRESQPQAVSAFVEEMAGVGVDIVKLNLSGESALDPMTSRIIQFTDEEVAAAAATARAHDIWLSAHAHSADAIKLGVRNGVRAIYHCTFADEEALDLIEEAKDRVFVAPTAGIIYAHLHDTDQPMDDGMEVVPTHDSVRKVVPQLQARGVRLVIGGDYGFPFNPVGKNLRDLELFVEWFGLTPAEALSAATRNGAQLMGYGDELGLVREGYLADLVLVDGDPLEDISIMQDRDRIAMVMKDGWLYKTPVERVRRPVAVR